VRSVLGELAATDELIIVDDQSTDRSRAIAEQFALKDGRVRVIDGPGDGIANALNTGLAACRGKYVARMDADDESLDGRIIRSVAALEADGWLAAVGTQVEIFREDQPVSPNMQAYSGWLNSLTSHELVFQDRYVESPLCHPSATIRRDALIDAGSFLHGPFPEDYALWLELLRRGHRLKNLPALLFRWRDHSARATRTDERYDQRRHMELKASYLAQEPALLNRECAILGAGKTGLALSRALLDRGVKTAFFVDVNPKKVGTKVQGVDVFGHEALTGPAEGGVHLLAAVGSKGGRAELRSLLTMRGYVEGRDFTCCA
jgi:hypothetical protein